MNRIIDVSTFAELRLLDLVTRAGRSTDTYECRRAEIDRSGTFWLLGVVRHTLPLKALGEGGFERGDALVQTLVLLARFAPSP